jgi:hypothetical protein
VPRCTGLNGAVEKPQKPGPGPALITNLRERGGGGNGHAAGRLLYILECICVSPAYYTIYKASSDADCADEYSKQLFFDTLYFFKYIDREIKKILGTINTYFHDLKKR